MFLGALWAIPRGTECHTGLPSGPVPSTPYFDFQLTPCMQASMGPSLLLAPALILTVPAFLHAHLLGSQNGPGGSGFVCTAHFVTGLRPQTSDPALNSPNIVQARFTHRRCGFHCPLSIVHALMTLRFVLNFHINLFILAQMRIKPFYFLGHEVNPRAILESLDKGCTAALGLLSDH